MASAEAEGDEDNSVPVPGAKTSRNKSFLVNLNPDGSSVKFGRRELFAWIR